LLETYIFLSAQRRPTLNFWLVTQISTYSYARSYPEATI